MATSTQDKRFSIYDAAIEARKVNVLGLVLLLCAAFFIGMGVFAYTVEYYADFIYFVGVGFIIYAADFVAYIFRMRKEERLKNSQYEPGEDSKHEGGSFSNPVIPEDKPGT